ncbi:unnamed protein product [Protopolystoma xenopodis]|uniref:Uncharacterized protein n=1 Tax=Protopolystoma xenopodis TaxID=117903 RepID=A0A3S5FC24_9PLAT|nr:unnamed protein product [Protopolystoma xenopodis]
MCSSLSVFFFTASFDESRLSPDSGCLGRAEGEPAGPLPLGQATVEPRAAVASCAMATCATAQSGSGCLYIPPIVCGPDASGGTIKKFRPNRFRNRNPNSLTGSGEPCDPVSDCRPQANGAELDCAFFLPSNGQIQSVKPDSIGEARSAPVRAASRLRFACLGNLKLLSKPNANIDSQSMTTLLP